ncbi:hypothetical protein H8957_003961 [Semnopithecus entellus]
MAAARCCLSLLLLSTCVALLLQPLLGAWGAPLEPLYPGGNATPEQMAQYAAELHRYINVLTKPRHVPRTWRETPAPGTLGSLHIPGHTLSPAQAPSPAPAPSRPLLGKQSICADQAWAHVPWASECLQADTKQVGWHLGTRLPCIGKKTKRTRWPSQSGVLPCCCPQGAQPAGTVTLPPASYHSMGSASPALPSTLLALAKTGSLFPQRLNKASQSHSLSLCLCGLLVQGSRKS